MRGEGDGGKLASLKWPHMRVRTILSHHQCVHGVHLDKECKKLFKCLGTPSLSTSGKCCGQHLTLHTDGA